jgi:hypothetical protein
LPDVILVCLSTSGNDANTAAQLIRRFQSAATNLTYDRLIKIVPMLMRVDRSELQLLMEAKKQIKAEFETLEMRKLLFQSEFEVPYVPFFQYVEAIAAIDIRETGENILFNAYTKILQHLFSKEELHISPLRNEDWISVMKRYEDPPMPLPLPSWWSPFSSVPKLRLSENKEGYIFISYARRDFDRIVLTLDQIQQIGYSIWWDDGIEPGEKWKDFLQKKIESCLGVVVFASRRASKSKWVQWEIAEAKRLGKVIIPIILDDLKKTMKLGKILAPYQHVPDPGIWPSEKLELALRILNL